MEKHIDTTKYRKLLCRLASRASRSDFPALFRQVLTRANVPDNLHFVLKMELKRLQKPCLRQIDLRGYVDGECQRVVVGDMTHYLDDIAKAVFKEQFKNFKGYTLGVFECVNNTPNNYRVMHARQKMSESMAGKPAEAKQDIRYQVPSLAFNNVHSRKEERMHFVSVVSLVNGEESTWIGKTVDLSVSGCQIKTNKKHAFQVGQVIKIRFQKFEEEFALGLDNGLDYKIVAVDTKDPDFNSVRLCRQRCESTLHFDAFLQNYIKGNKRRYKINLDSAVQSVINRGYAQHSMPRRSDLNIFLRPEQFELVPFMAVTTDMNQALIEYWTDSRHKLFIGHALTAERLALLRNKLEKEQPDSYLYTFSGVNKHGEKVFYAAFKEELEADPELKKLFLTMGSKQYDFRVFSVTLSESSERYAYQPFSLVTDNIKAFKKLNKPPSPRVMHKLKGLSHILSIKDITTDDSRQDYVFSGAGHAHVEKVRALKVERIKNRHLPLVPIRHVESKGEERCEYRTPVAVNFENRVYAGHTAVLSTKGIKVRFDVPIDFPLKREVLVDFPEVSAQQTGIDLTKLRYRIISINVAKTQLCLSVSGDIRTHSGRKFARAMIGKKKAHLTDHHARLQDAELSWCVQNILSASSTTFTAYLSRKGRQLCPVIATPGSFKSQFVQQISGKNAIDMAFLFNSAMGRKYIETGLARSQLNNTPARHDIYLAVKGNSVTTKLDADFSNAAEKALFVKNVTDNGQFYCLSASMVRTGRPDMARVTAELNYISLYSMHKGKEIEDALYNVCGVVEFKEITEEVVSRVMPHLESRQASEAA